MTKTKKTIMWATIACLLVVGVAGATVGVTYARYATSSTGSGSASIAYWDVAVTPSESTEVSVYAEPSADAYTGTDGTYAEEYARSNTSDLMVAAVIANSGNVAAEVTVEQTGTLSYTKRTEAEDTNGYLSTLDDHFTVSLFVGDADNITDENDLTALEDAFTVGASVDDQATNLYIYCEVVWTSDISNDCCGSAADAFDTWIGTNVATIDFTLSYTAVQTVTGSPD